MVGEGDGADAREDEVLRDLVGKGFDRYEEDVRIAYPGLSAGTWVVVAVCAPVLGFEAPEANLSVVEGDLVWRMVSNRCDSIQRLETVPAETVSACAMAATTSPAASGAGRVPVPVPASSPLAAGAGGSAGLGGIGSAMIDAINSTKTIAEKTGAGGVLEDGAKLPGPGKGDRGGERERRAACAHGPMWGARVRPAPARLCHKRSLTDDPPPLPLLRQTPTPQPTANAHEENSMPRTQPNSPSPPPAPASFPFATGGFDFPQASASPPPPRSRPSPRARVNQLTEFLNQHYQHVNNEDDAPAQRRPQTSRDIGPRRRSSQRNARLPHHAEREPESVNGRPAGTPSERYLRGGIARIRDIRSVIEDPATDVLDSLSDLPRNPFRRDRSASLGDIDGRHQTKRRKYNHTPYRSEHDGFKYGYKGQVVRGRLRMEVVSCDGGEYDRDSSLYKVQNVLSNDKSVYCSQSGRCNLLLKHIGDTPFCLEKMVIRAPDRGFTAPVQEGMIFVSMSPDKLISGTSAYEIEYNTKDFSSSSMSDVRLSSPLSPTPSPPRGRESEFLSFEEALRDEALEESFGEEAARRQATVDRIDRIERMRLRTRGPPFEAARNQFASQPSAAADDTSPNECPYHIEEGDSSAAGISAPTPPPFTTTTESEPEDAEGSDDMPSAAIMADRLRRESRYRSEGEDDDDRDDLIQHPLAALRRAEPLTAQPFLEGPISLQNHHERAQRWRALRNPIGPIRATRLRTPSRIEPKRERHGRDDEVIQPSARFFIQRHRNKITVKFHPAMYVFFPNSIHVSLANGYLDRESTSS